MRTLPAIVLLLAASPALGQSFDICTAADSSGTEATEDRVLLCDKTSDVPISVTLGSIRPPASEIVAGICELSTSAETTAGLCVQASDTRLSDPRTPSGAASGDLSGTYPSPALAVDTVGLDELAACAGPGEIVEYGAAGVPACIATPGGGSSIILDLGDDAANESTALAEIATTSTPAGMFTEPAADKLLIDGAIPWTAATKLDADGDGTPEVSVSTDLLFDPDDSGTAECRVKANGVLSCSLEGADWPFGLFFEAIHSGGKSAQMFNSGTSFQIAADNGQQLMLSGYSGNAEISIDGEGLTRIKDGANVLIEADHDGTRGLVTISDLLRLHNAATPPVACTAGISGSMFYDTTTPTPCWCNGSTTTWTPFAAGGDCT